ncbi:hypothetical protein SAMN02745857_01784 [Andreprevotia lacus DSM 23236]|jgi:hypothetical protein|uniref:Uncharacterized protein n=1 Tax=Andreprevotia lacus DSM 23236 TaxID=1121001 RepID=A0A1W1XL17_9NEIS|nr:hypothetical protein [Andreprevotia lacus]SMC24241.1 hypothetical protein SAMN02745857_01784 [Andreprevotia lacus DSM 23236]
MNFARVVDGVAVDVSREPAVYFPALLVAEFVEVPDEVAPQWRLNEAGEWVSPAGAGAYLPELVIVAIEPDADHAAAVLLNGLHDVTCPAGTVLTFRAELRGPAGVLIPVSDVFRMPLRARDGRERMVLAVMEEGAMTVNVPLRESGAWAVDEATINESLPLEKRMRFAGVQVFVVEV